MDYLRRSRQLPIAFPVLPPCHSCAVSPVDTHPLSVLVSPGGLPDLTSSAMENGDAGADAPRFSGRLTL